MVLNRTFPATHHGAHAQHGANAIHTAPQESRNHVEQVRRLQAENEDLRLRLNQLHAASKNDPALRDATLKALVDKLGREKRELGEELAAMEGQRQELRTTQSRLSDEVRTDKPFEDDWQCKIRVDWPCK